MTWEEVCSIVPRPYAECALSAFRNVLRDEAATRAQLAALQLGGGGDPSDLRCPDWRVILQSVRKRGEHVVSFDPSQLPDPMLWRDVRVAVRITTQPAHVVAIWKGAHGFRIYDNDSMERQAGGSRQCGHRELMGKSSVLALTEAGNALSDALEDAERSRRVRALLDCVDIRDSPRARPPI
jgi:hypothetical protein